MRLLAKLVRAPNVLKIIAKNEWAQMQTRGIAPYLRFQAKVLRSHLSGTYPAALQIEPYGGCNIRCAMCFQGRMPLPADKQMMDLDLFCKIVDEVSPVTPILYLYWRGEPLLHPDIGKMVYYAKSKEMYVFISTSATMMTEDLSIELIDAGLDFALIGMDGATKNIYEAMRKGAKFDEVTKNVRCMTRLRAERRKRLPHVCLQFIVSAINVHELHRMPAIVRALGADSFTEKTLDVYENFASVKIKKALTPLFTPGQFSKYTKTGNGFEYSRSGECVMARRMVVRVDGRLSLCCYDMQERFPIGSVIDGDLLQTWASSEYRALRARGTKRETSLCMNCGTGIQK